MLEYVMFSITNSQPIVDNPCPITIANWRGERRRTPEDVVSSSTILKYHLRHPLAVFGGC